MIEQVNESEFINRFALMDRRENFSYEGRLALFEYFEGLEEDLSEQIEFDCIAICCEYSEYENLQDFWNQGFNKEDYPDLDTIRENTIVIGWEQEDTERFIIADF
jgi:hypothetical protein